MKKILYILPIIALLAAGCGQKKDAGRDLPVNTQSTSQTPNANQADFQPDTTTIKTYTNLKYGISFQYPSNYEQVTANNPNAQLTTLVTLARLDASGYVYVSTDNQSYNEEAITKAYSLNGTGAGTTASFGTNSFFQLDPVEGGLFQPDVFYFNAKGKMIQFDFDGTYSSTDSHPDGKTKQAETKILSSVKAK